MSNHIFPKPTDSAVYTPLPTTSSPNSHLQIINLEQHLHMRRGGRSFVEGERRPFVEVGGRPRRSFVNVGRRPQASKSKIQGETVHSLSKETVHQARRLFIERQGCPSREGGGCSLQERVFMSGEGVHHRRGCSFQERACIAGEGIHRRREEGVIAGGRRASVTRGRRPFVAGGEEAARCRREEAFVN
jgi:hypothetical protein